MCLTLIDPSFFEFWDRPLLWGLLNDFFNVLDKLKYTKKGPFNIKFHKKKFSSGGAQTHEKEQKMMKDYEDLDGSNSAKQLLPLY